MSHDSNNNTHALYPPVPEGLASFGNGVTRRIGRFLLRLVGWRLVGELPKEKRLVLAAAPHTSNWDFVSAMLIVMATGVQISYLMKKEAFFWPFRDLFLWLGGVPIDRSASQDTVEQITDYYKKQDKLWVVFTPEGTRSKVERWKTGFVRVAHEADVPVLLIAWDYPSKTMRLDKLWHTTGDHESDAEAIREYMCSRYTGKYPDKQ